MGGTIAYPVTTWRWRGWGLVILQGPLSQQLLLTSTHLTRAGTNAVHTLTAITVLSTRVIIAHSHYCAFYLGNYCPQPLLCFLLGLLLPTAISVLSTRAIIAHSHYVPTNASSMGSSPKPLCHDMQPFPKEETQTWLI